MAAPPERSGIDERVTAPAEAGGELVPEVPPTPPGPRWTTTAVLRLVLTLLLPIAAVAVLWLAFDFLRDSDANRLLIVLVAIGVGVLGVFGLFWAMDQVVDRL